MNPSQLIDQQIESFPDWRGKMMKQLRKLIHQADSNLVEEWKWGTGVWTYNGLVCAVSAFKDHVKINFFNGADLTDSEKIFNGGLESKRNRSIDFFEKDSIPDSHVIDLIKQAVAHNK